MSQPAWKIRGKRQLRLVKKLIAVHLKGGACAMCGARELEDLEFHHPEKNRRYEAGLTTLSFKKIFEELLKVLLLCASCHALIDEDRRSKKNYGWDNQSESAPEIDERAS
jgi:hypothetical protein